MLRDLPSKPPSLRYLGISSLPPAQSQQKLRAVASFDKINQQSQHDQIFDATIVKDFDSIINMPNNNAKVSQ